MHDKRRVIAPGLRIASRLLRAALALVLGGVFSGSLKSATAGAAESPENQVFQFMERGTFAYGEGDVVTSVAYLWIPEQCARLRGLLILGENVPEHGLVGHRAIREACRANDLGIVWCTPTFFSRQQPREAGQTIAFLQGLLAGLARTSGYDEVATVPWLPMGESFHLRMVYHLLDGAPERCIAGIFIKNAPSLRMVRNRTTPVLVTVGTAQEWFQNTFDIRLRWKDLSFYRTLLKERAAFPDWPATFRLHRGYGPVLSRVHFRHGPGPDSPGRRSVAPRARE